MECSPSVDGPHSKEFQPAHSGNTIRIRITTVLSHLIVDNTPSLPRPSPPWGRAWTAAGAFVSRGGPGEGVPANLLVVNNNAGQDTSESKGFPKVRRIWDGIMKPRCRNRRRGIWTPRAGLGEGFCSKDLADEDSGRIRYLTGAHVTVALTCQGNVFFQSLHLRCLLSRDLRPNLRGVSKSHVTCFCT